MSPAIELLIRVRAAAAAGGKVDDADLAHLARTIDLALTGESFETALGLGGGWRSMVRSRIRSDAALENARGSVASRAHDLHVELTRYFARSFDRDLVNTLKPKGDDRAFYDIIVSEGGVVPSERTLRRRLTALGLPRITSWPTTTVDLARPVLEKDHSTPTQRATKRWASSKS